MACIYVCRGNHVCLNAHVSYASAADPFQGTKEEHSRFGHAKGASVSTFSSHSQARADRFTKHLPFRKACTARIRAVIKFGNTVSHIGRTVEIVIVVTTSSFSPCVPPQNTACTSCATTALCDSKKSVHFLPRCVQHLHWFVFVSPFSGTSPSSRRVLGGVMVLLQYLVRITSRSSAQADSTCRKKGFLSTLRSVR